MPDNQVQNPTPLAYNVTDAAEQLSVSKNHLRKLLASGELPHRRSGSRVLIPRAALEAFLEPEQK